MRIVAGRLRGRRLYSPQGARPTTERVREALFALLDVHEMRVLEPFAGSGAVSLEALSRGAASALLIEIDRASCTQLARNLELVSSWGQARLLRGDAWCLLPELDEQFDLIFADPPYATGWGSRVHAAVGPLCAAGALLIIEQGAKEKPPQTPKGWSRLTVRRYGASAIVVDRFDL